MTKQPDPKFKTAVQAAKSDASNASGHQLAIARKVMARRQSALAELAK